MELTYTKCGDYLIPDLVLSDTKEYHIGKYGRLRRAYLKEHRHIPFTLFGAHRSGSCFFDKAGLWVVGSCLSFCKTEPFSGS